MTWPGLASTESLPFQDSGRGSKRRCEQLYVVHSPCATLSHPIHSIDVINWFSWIDGRDRHLKGLHRDYRTGATPTSTKQTVHVHSKSKMFVFAWPAVLAFCPFEANVVRSLKIRAVRVRFACRAPPPVLRRNIYQLNCARSLEMHDVRVRFARHVWLLEFVARFTILWKSPDPNATYCSSCYSSPCNPPCSTVYHLGAFTREGNTE